MVVYFVHMHSTYPFPIICLISNKANNSFQFSYRTTHPWYDRPFIGQSMNYGVLIHRVPSGVAYTDTALVSAMGVEDEGTGGASIHAGPLQ